jgi:hypothetical protein
MDNLNSVLLFDVNMLLSDFYSAYGSIEPIGPQEHLVHGIVRQTLDSFIVAFYVSVTKQKSKYLRITAFFK